jgi:hypothetical protein
MIATGATSVRGGYPGLVSGVTLGTNVNESNEDLALTCSSYVSKWDHLLRSANSALARKETLAVSKVGTFAREICNNLNQEIA